MFSATKLMAGAAVLALTSGFLLSGVLTFEPDEQLPAAAPERGDFIIVTGSAQLSSGGGAPTGSSTMSDPRVSGDLELINRYLTGVGLTGVQWGLYTLTNDGGSWEGEWIGFYESPSGKENAMVWASGTGDYEGWSYVANYTENLRGLDVRGLVYQGPIPPTVVLGALEAETE
ncbi:MAG: hypothetical protein U9O18_03845 [Chloroflexota bacterium]|nr:hypothetical protein [Chloroflexota bacterium]